MFKLFKRTKRKVKWNVLFVDKRGQLKEAKIVAYNRRDVFEQMNRIFGYACVISSEVI